MLDDVRGEGEEVTQHNKWLTYGPPLHLAVSAHQRARTAQQVCAASAASLCALLLLTPAQLADPACASACVALRSQRTFGLPGKLFDALDEQRLLPSQIKEFVETLLGCDILPEPEIDCRAFVAGVKAALTAEGGGCEVVDPASGRVQPWLNVRELEPRCARGTRASARSCERVGERVGEHGR